MKKIISLTLAAVMFFAMTITASAEDWSLPFPGRISPGELENNAVLGGKDLDHSTFIPVSTGVGQCLLPDQDSSGMTAVIRHVNPTYTTAATRVAEKHGGEIVCAFGCWLPALAPSAKVIFDVKEGYEIPTDIQIISAHGRDFCSPSVEWINERQFAITLDGHDRNIYVVKGSSLEPGTEETYRECLESGK